MTNSIWTPGSIPTAVYPTLSAVGGSALINGSDQIVNNFAGVRALSKLSPSLYATSLGAVLPNDGGGGNYYYNAADTTSAESLPNIIVATDGGRWYLAPYTATSLLAQVAADTVVVNGDMSVAQLGTTYALTTSVNGYSNIDNWIAYQSGTANGVCNQVAAPAGSGFEYMMKLGRNSGAVTTGPVATAQVLESHLSIPYAGQQVTLSFYAKAGVNFSSAGNALLVQLFSGTGYDQPSTTLGGWPGNILVVNTTATLTTGLVRYSYTVNISSTAQQLGLYIAYTPVGIAGADDNVYITGVRIDPGAVALTPKVTSYQQRLAICQRYLQVGIGLGIQGYGNVGNNLSSIKSLVNMRVIPTITFSGTSYTNCSSVSALYTNTDCFVFMNVTTVTGNTSMNTAWKASGAQL